METNEIFKNDHVRLSEAVIEMNNVFKRWALALGMTKEDIKFLGTWRLFTSVNSYPAIGINKENIVHEIEFITDFEGDGCRMGDLCLEPCHTDDYFRYRIPLTEEQKNSFPKMSNSQMEKFKIMKFLKSLGSFIVHEKNEDEDILVCKMPWSQVEEMDPDFMLSEIRTILEEEFILSGRVGKIQVMDTGNRYTDHKGDTDHKGYIDHKGFYINCVDLEPIVHKFIAYFRNPAGDKFKAEIWAGIPNVEVSKAGKKMEENTVAWGVFNSWKKNNPDFFLMPVNILLEDGDKAETDRREPEVIMPKNAPKGADNKKEVSNYLRELAKKFKK